MLEGSKWNHICRILSLQVLGSAGDDSPQAAWDTQTRSGSELLEF